MATTVYGNTVNGVWRVYLTYEVTTNNDTTYTVTITSGLNIPTSGYKSSRAYNLTVYQNGASKYTGSLASGTRYGSNSWSMVSSKTISVTKTTAQQTLTIEAKLKGSSESTLSTKSVSFTVPAKTSYTVSYNANGGSLPSSGFTNPQTKWYNTTLTLNTGKPTRTGYTFLRWNTNSSGSGTNYASGASYTANAGATLSAVWQANTVAISYDANGGSGSIAIQTKAYDQTLTLSNGAGFTRANHSIVKWNTQADGGGTDYQLSDVLSATFLTPLTLYAQWHLDYIAPTITNFNAYRVDTATSSAETDDGGYIYVTFGYQAGTAGTGWETPTCTITIDNTQVYTGTLTIDADGHGTFPASVMAFGGSYSKDLAHTVEVTLVDTYNVPVTQTATISTATYPIDLVGSGNDVYMGIMTPAVNGQPLTIAGVVITDDSTVSGDLNISGDSTATNLTADTLTIDGSLVVDYVVSQGTLNNGGHYRKWASGKAEFWYHLWETSGMTTVTWVSPITYYDSTSYTSLWSGVFNASPYAVFVNSSHSQFIAVMPYAYDKDGITNLRFISVGVRTNSGYAFSVYAEGTWK